MALRAPRKKMLGLPGSAPTPPPLHPLGPCYIDTSVLLENITPVKFIILHAGPEWCIFHNLTREFYRWRNFGNFPPLFYWCLFVYKIKRLLTRCARSQNIVLPLENKIHIFAPPCNILHIQSVTVKTHSLFRIDFRTCQQSPLKLRRIVENCFKWTWKNPKNFTCTIVSIAFVPWLTGAGERSFSVITPSIFMTAIICSVALIYVWRINPVNLKVLVREQININAAKVHYLSY